MSPKSTREPLERTSVQLPRQTLDLLNSWPDVSRSEALRLIVDRYIYLESVAAPFAEQIVERYRPVFHYALGDLSGQDYKFVARSLPAIVMDAMAEENIRESAERERATDREQRLIDWKELEREIRALEPMARIRILDYVLGEQHHARESAAAGTE